MLQQQVDVLTDAYRGRQAQAGHGGSAPPAPDSHIDFHLSAIEYIESATWAGDCANQPWRHGGYAEAGAVSVVHVFSCPNQGLVGFTFLPWTFSEGHFRDMIMIHPGTVPGLLLPSS